MRATVFFIGLALAPNLYGTALYFQPPLGLPDIGFTWASHIGSDFTARTYDDFSLAVDGAVHQITWWGTYYDATPGQQFPSPTTETWQFDFHADSGSFSPGALLATVSLPDATVSRVTRGTGILNDELITLYEFSATFPGSFLASAGQTYWLTVTSITSQTFNPQFTWVQGSGGGDNSSLQLFGGTLFLREGDRAFLLLGDVDVPEPGGAELAGIGLFTLAAFWRMRR